MQVERASTTFVGSVGTVLDYFAVKWKYLIRKIPLSRSRRRTSSLAMEFMHRTKADGTIHSICPRCYAPIGSARRETDLERAETDHICDPVLLAYFERARRSGAKQPAGNSHKK